MRKWLLIGTVIAVALIAAPAVLVFAISPVSGDLAQDFAYQCRSQLGADPLEESAASPTPTPVSDYPRGADPAIPAAPVAETSPVLGGRDQDDTTSSQIVTNPYAGLTAPADTSPDEARCVQAVATARYQQPPLTDATAGAQGRLAATVASHQLGLLARASSGTLNGATEGAFSAAGLARYAIYTGSGHTVVLAEDPASQISYGQRVLPSAAAPGDLVFDHFVPGRGAGHVAVVLDSTTVVDVPAAGGLIVAAAFPHGDIVVKRILS